MLMRLAMCRINHQPLHVCFIDELLKQFFPHPLVLPAAQAPVGVGATCVFCGQVAPGGAGAKNPQQRVNEAAIVLDNTAPAAGASG